MKENSSAGFEGKAIFSTETLFRVGIKHLAVMKLDEIKTAWRVKDPGFRICSSFFVWNSREEKMGRGLKSKKEIKR